MTATHYIFIDNTSSVQLSALKSAITGEYVNDAVVTMTLKDGDGNAVAGESWPIALQYVMDSNGNYIGAFSHEVAVADGESYVAEVDAVLTDGSRASWDEPVMALTRTAETQLKKWWPHG
jgi:hypothetical protein